MGSDLKRANKLFEELYQKMKDKRLDKGMLFLFYLKGYTDNSGMETLA